MICRLRHRAGIWLVRVLFSSLLWICCVRPNMPFGHQHELLSSSVTGQGVATSYQLCASAPGAGAHSHSSSLPVVFTLLRLLSLWMPSSILNYHSSLDLQGQTRAPFGRSQNKDSPCHDLAISGDRKQMDAQTEECAGKQRRQRWPARWWAALTRQPPNCCQVFFGFI